MSSGANDDPEQRHHAHENDGERRDLVASRQAESSPSVAICCENVVTKAVESAPSAKRSRNMFGARKAVRNASMLLASAEERRENHFAEQARERGCTKWRCRRRRSREC